MRRNNSRSLSQTFYNEDLRVSCGMGAQVEQFATDRHYMLGVLQEHGELVPVSSSNIADKLRLQ